MVDACSSFEETEAGWSKAPIFAPRSSCGHSSRKLSSGSCTAIVHLSRTFAPNETEDQGQRCNYRARFGEPFAIARVEGELSILGNINFASEHAFVESVAGVIAQHLRDAAELVHETSYTRVC